MSLSLLAQVALAAGPIVAFLEGTVVYALSQQWEDLLSTYLFRLHAVPNLPCLTPQERASRGAALRESP